MDFDVVRVVEFSPVIALAILKDAQERISASDPNVIQVHGVL